MDGNGLFHRGIENHQQAAGLLVVLLFCTNCIQPTGNLDSKTSDEVIELLKVTSKKFHQTIVMITHNPEIAEQADRTIRIEDGKIHE